MINFVSGEKRLKVNQFFHESFARKLYFSFNWYQIIPFIFLRKKLSNYPYLRGFLTLNCHTFRQFTLNQIYFYDYA